MSPAEKSAPSTLSASKYWRLFLLMPPVGSPREGRKKLNRRSACRVTNHARSVVRPPLDQEVVRSG
jgi:hypothetical protein